MSVHQPDARHLAAVYFEGEAAPEDCLRSTIDLLLDMQAGRAFPIESRLAEHLFDAARLAGQLRRKLSRLEPTSVALPMLTAHRNEGGPGWSRRDGLIDIALLLDLLELFETERRRAEQTSGPARLAARLRRKLSQLDPTSLAMAMLGGRATGLAPTSSRRDGLTGTTPLLDLLGRAEVGLREQAGVPSRTSAGRPKRPDVLTFGVDSLRAIWVRFRADRPDQSGLHGRFGALVQDVLGGEPFGFSDGSIRKAVAAALPRPAPQSAE